MRSEIAPVRSGNLDIDCTMILISGDSEGFRVVLARKVRAGFAAAAVCLQLPARAHLTVWLCQDICLSLHIGSEEGHIDKMAGAHHAL